MSATRHIITLGTSARTTASRGTVYGVLADLQTHAEWGGEGTGEKKFRLLTLNAPEGAVTRGSRFSSTGVVQMGTFHDELVVVDAVPGDIFAFHADSVLERKRAQAWRGSFEHTYTLRSDGADTVLSYSCEIYTHSYVPYWWRAPMRVMTKLMIARYVRNSLRSLAFIAEASERAASATSTLSSAAAAA